MKKGITRRTSKQRNTVLEELKKVKTHPTADSIFRIVRRKLPSISFGTVYRNLNLLKADGKILELTCGKYSCRYDGEVRNHYHFLCLKCKKVLDLDEPILKHLDEKIGKTLRADVKYHRIDFYGYCRSCKSR